MLRKALAFALAIGLACTAGLSVGATTRAPDGSSGGSGAKIEAILNAWQIMPSAQGRDVAAWRDMMRIQLKMASPATLDSLYSMQPPRDAQLASQQFVGFMNVLGADIAQRLNAQKEAQRAKSIQSVRAAADGGASGESGARSTDLISPQFLGEVGVDQVFQPITPCRVVDTRNVGGVYGNFATRNWYYYTVIGTWNWFTTQGGVFGPASTACPETFFTYSPSAAVATITVTGQGGAGNLIAWGGENPVASASTMSYPASGDTSSLATIPWGGRSGTGAGGTVLDFAVKVNAPTTTHVVVDIVGYYTQPEATALDCINRVTTDTAVPPGNFNVFPPACSAGYTATGGGCRTPSFNVATWAIPAALFTTTDNSTAVSLSCSGTNITAGNISVNAMVRCCRVPGR